MPRPNPIPGSKPFALNRSDSVEGYRAAREQGYTLAAGWQVRQGFWHGKPDADEIEIGTVRVRSHDPEIPFFAKRIESEG